MKAIMIASADDWVRGRITQYLNRQEDVLCINNDIIDALVEYDTGIGNKYDVEDARIVLNSIKDVVHVTLLNNHCSKNHLYKLYNDTFGFKAIEIGDEESLVSISKKIMEVAR